MRKVIIVFVAALLSISARAQTNQHTFTDVEYILGTNQEYRENDTIRSFNIIDGNADKYREELLKNMPKPVKESAGKIVWENNTIDNLGANLTVTFTDGILIEDHRAATSCWTMFESQDDKDKTLSKALKNNEWRMTQISIKDQDGNNPVNSNEKEDIARKFIMEKIKS